MAYYSDPNMQDDQLEGQGVNLSGGQGASLDAGVPGAQGGTAKKADNPGNFVGLNQYLSANRNQANQFGEKVASGVENKINTANQNISGLQNQFKSEADKGLIQGFQGAKDEASNIVNKAATGGINELPDTNSQSRFGQIANANYSGPKNVQEANSVYNPVYQSVQEAQRLADLSKSEGGSKELVKDFSNKNKQYTSGANRLDSYLLNTQENKQKIQDAQKNAGLLQPGLAQAVEGSNQYAKSLQDQTNALKNDVRNLFQNTAMGKRASVDQDLAAQKAKVDADNARIRELSSILGDTSDKGSVSLTPEQMKLLGLRENQNLYGALNKAPNYYLGSESAFDPNAAISKEEQARLQALSGLAGTYGANFSNPYGQKDLAGTYQYSNPLEAAKAKLAAEIDRGESTFNSQFDNKAALNDYYARSGISPTTGKDTLLQDIGIGRNTISKAPSSFYDIESHKIPQFLDAGVSDATTGFYGQHAKDLQRLLDSWKESRGYNDRVNVKK